MGSREDRMYSTQIKPTTIREKCGCELVFTGYRTRRRINIKCKIHGLGKKKIKGVKNEYRTKDK